MDGGREGCWTGREEREGGWTFFFFFFWPCLAMIVRFITRLTTTHSAYGHVRRMF